MLSVTFQFIIIDILLCLDKLVSNIVGMVFVIILNHFYQTSLLKIIVIIHDNIF